MTNEKLELLVRTPGIKPDESFRGYFLRLAEANGYDSQAKIFTLANINKCYHPNPTLENTIKLERFLGHGNSHLRQNCNRRGDKSHFSVMGLQFHTSVFRKNSAICPDCIKEFGYIPAFADLKSIRCCPAHRKWLIDTCPACSKSIPWFRPGLQICTCGTALSHQSGSTAPPSRKEIADASRFVKSLCSGPRDRIFNSSAVRTGFSYIQLTAAISANRRLVESAKSLAALT